MIGFPPESRGYVFEDCGPVWIGNNNHFAGHCTVDSNAVIGDNLFMMKHAHIGHDCIVKNSVTLCTGSVLGGHVTVNEGANIGLNAVIHQKQTIGAYAMIGMGAAIFDGAKVTDFSKWAVRPAMHIGENTFPKERGLVSEEYLIGQQQMIEI